MAEHVDWLLPTMIPGINIGIWEIELTNHIGIWEIELTNHILARQKVVLCFVF